MERFKGKTVVVTGGNRGIGFAIAGRFAAEGANVVIGSVEEAVADAAAELCAMGARAVGVLCDVTDRDAVVAMYDRAEREFGSIDVSVQNAGVITIARVEDMTEAEWDLNLNVNTKGAFLCCQEAIRRMRKTGGGRLINMASGQARDGFIYTPHYAASKYGVMGMTQSLAKEVALDNITVNAICPGIIKSDMWDYNDRVWGKMMGDFGPGELMASWVQNIPMKRAGEGKDVAGLIAFLASEDADYITGQTINVDGGLIMS
ncbi:MAG: glucose 1-dehydrogenase [Roseibium album]|uniref:SDR family NAD(P)-dependent oxidoreductase n=1 Tax=Roseibium album TaxID=311410 RepID=UPI0018CAC936|nr:glucose 1-dehydrogenase [Roseibium album]MBG6161776.1 meso-butanediol dehydrogenase/(S,S)-butanediol dehydrogenase/diacetyl reductase [Labrenzia sp. EL_195]MBG6178746.1 meso-butanediol dehydrogenase/(S,S)-butanediol dehydrogenase/diacetyl reductase [Labrenzia sp. EL_132]MBG6199740.1 meso-butanediol dehydrogenase/(S,S)-butanediol dehydrogenase/diacetyl reductase [Labrenzia sp. EL_13]MBG6233370.1 meso-butanediol dehydrogenase/(S,S)-butanediol dehydrogenase/diacetyl reductase [Labrenzia sp. EL_